ncbi:MAG TPA: BTAD domain-containing putative transcriptional regulator [Gemmatimonadaceae bacterium]|nr:BTAD domain-containing putative transcriptional regulator [Gemmatimonadaceae bacterium]
MDSSPEPSPAPIVNLRTFGGTLLEGPHGVVTGALSQRRRLAVLSLLAASGTGISRDRLLGLLWPESDEDRARHTLSQLLHGLRRELADDVIIANGAALRLNSNIVSSDVSDFAAALATGDDARAVNLYRGVFLDGFYLNGCPDFERWVDERRATLARQAEDAIERLAKRSGANSPTESAEWWRRLAALRPLDSRVALALMEALAVTGDRAGALQVARSHTAVLKEELDAAPIPEIAEYAESLRGETVASPTQSVAPVVASQRPPDSDALAGTATGSAPIASAEPGFASRLKHSSFRFGALAVAAIALIGVALMLGLRAAADPSGSTPRWLLIADVENTTGDSVFDRTVPVALAAALVQSPRIRVVSPDRIGRALVRMRRPAEDVLLTEKLAREIAQRDGVPMVAVPAISRAENAYELTTRILDGSTGAVLGFSAVRAERRGDVLDALDRLGRDLRGKLGESSRSIRANTVPLPLVTTASLDALKKFAEGERAFRTARPEDARNLWTQAVAIDSAFAIACANLGMVEYWDNKPTTGDSLYALAFRHLGTLPERERVMIRSSARSWQGDHAGAAVLLTTFLADHPDDFGALRQLGYEYFRMGEATGAADAFTRVLAVDSLDYSVWINLASSEKLLHHYPRSVQAYRRAFTLAPMQLTANNNLNLEFARTFVLAGQPDSAAVVIAALAASPDAPRRARALRSTAFLSAYNGAYADASASLVQAIELNRTGAPGTSEVRNRLLLATMLDERGHSREAARQLDSAEAVAAHIDAETTLLYWLGKAVAREGDAPRASRILTRLEAKVHVTSATDRAALEALRGEVLMAERRPAEGLAHLKLAAQADSTSVVLESLAYGTATSGDLEGAVALYERLGRGNDFGWEGQHNWRVASYWLARVQERAGNAARARAAYEQFISQWRRPDADLHSVVDARERLARLRSREKGG